jgi:hypothetical protein
MSSQFDILGAVNYGGLITTGQPILSGFHCPKCLSGTTQEKHMVKRRRIDIDGDTATVWLGGKRVLMDASKLHLLDGNQIEIKKTDRDVGCGYPRLRSNKTRKRIGFLSRLVMDAPHGMEVDHINHDTMDNRAANLRICTRSQNRMNSIKAGAERLSKYKGVTYQDARKYNPRATGKKPWRAYIKIDGKRKCLGYYATEEQAAQVYDMAAKEMFGEYALYNMGTPPGIDSNGR